MDRFNRSGVLKRTFTVDTRMRWCILGKPSGLLTRWIEFGISAYMQLPWWQEIIMLPVPLLSTLLGIHPLFETIPSRGKVTFVYRVTGSTVEVQVDSDMPVMPQDTLCLLNESSAAWFTAGWDGNRPVFLLPVGKSQLVPTAGLLLIPCMGSGSSWTSHRSACLCPIPSTGAGNRPGKSAGQGSVLNWGLLTDRRD